ncbi:MAG: GNAT family N-acetyltransferase [Fusobacteriaceae bacterium]|nr:GNAT family N-acetyltransferase [Fusobacteriaceae bacterium]
MKNIFDVNFLEGEWVRLERFDKNRHLIEIFKLANEDESIFNFLSFGPYKNIEDFSSWIDSQEHQGNRITFAVFSKRLNKYVGNISITFIEENYRNAEIGCVWYEKLAQRTEINRESVFLLLKYLFDEMNYIRVQWRCDIENIPSKNAAEKMGFSYEGTFRNYAIFKGKVRHTSFFSIISSEWVEVKNKFENELLRKYKV